MLSYSIQECPNPDVIVIDVSIELPYFYSGIDSIDDLSGPEKELAKDVLDIRGIGDFHFLKYTIQLMKARIFSWDDIVPKVKEAIRKHLAAPGEMVEV